MLLIQNEGPWWVSPVGLLTQRSGRAPAQIMLFLCAKFLLQVQLDSAFFHPRQPFENCQYTRPELSDGCICFTTDRDFNVKSSGPLRMGTEADLREESLYWSSCTDAVTSLSALEGVRLPRWTWTGWMLQPVQALFLGESSAECFIWSHHWWEHPQSFHKAAFTGPNPACGKCYIWGAWCTATKFVALPFTWLFRQMLPICIN